MFVKALILMLALCLPSFAEATTYFADFVAGNDANAGTSTSVPWKRMPGMANETTGVTLASGDLVCLKGGVTWVDVLTPKARITYASIGGGGLNVLAACVGWGTGKAVIHVPLSATASGAIIMDGTSDYAIIDGLKVINDDNVNVNTRCAIYIQGTNGNHLIYPVVQFSEATLSESGICVTGYTDGFLIWNNDAHDNDTTKASCLSTGIFINGQTATDVNNGIIRHNNLYNNGPSCYDIPLINSNGRGLSFQTGGTTILVEFNTIYNNGGYPDGVGVDAGGVTEVIFRNNVVSGFETAEIKASSNNWKIYGNKFTNTDNQGTFNYGYFITDSIGTTITNNTFISSIASAGWVVGFTSPGTTTTFANNVLVCQPGHTGPAIVFSQVTGWAQSTWDGHVYNNAVQGCAKFADVVTSGGSHTLYTLIDYQVAYPQQGQASLFATNLGVLATYQICCDSPIKGAGALFLPCVDVRGAQCSQPPDLGAYQTTSGGSMILPRLSLTQPRAARH